MTTNAVPEGHYRIRKAGAKSQISNSIWNGKKCHYVQIGLELTGFESLEDAIEFIDGKGLVADKMSLDFGVKPAEPEEPAVADSDDGVEAVADSDDAAVEGDDEAAEAVTDDEDSSAATA